MLTSLAGIVWGAYLGNMIRFQPPALQLGNAASAGVPSVIVIGVCGLLLLAWLLYINERYVRDTGYVYAQRLLETLHSLDTRQQVRAGASMV